MCNCENKNKCPDCQESYNHYNVEDCNSCGDKEVKCKKTIDAKCVINTEDLSFLGVKAEDKVDVQTLLISINNALKSISDMLCVEYTRTINPNTGVASYNHELDVNCIAQQICPLCDNE